jgi:ATP-dependent protease ClpP protease subunit
MKIVTSLLSVLFGVATCNIAFAESANVTGGYGCDRGSEGAICFSDNSCMCGFSMSIDGALDSTTADKVRHLFEARRMHSKVDEGFEINSPGGSVAAAMEIGRLFRKERAWIAVKQNGVCVSACVLILAGAVNRVTSPGRVGIHRPYLITSPQQSFTADNVKQSYSRMLQDLRAYLREMNVSERLADNMLAVEPEKVRYLTSAELQGYGLAGIDPAEQQTQAIENEMRDVEEASKLGLGRLEYTRRKALGNSLCTQMTVRQETDCKQQVLKVGH